VVNWLPTLDSNRPIQNNRKSRWRNGDRSLSEVVGELLMQYCAKSEFIERFKLYVTLLKAGTQVFYSHIQG